MWRRKELRSDQNRTKKTDDNETKKKCEDGKNFEVIKIETVVNTISDPALNASVQRIRNDDFEYEELLRTYTLSEAWVYMALTT